MMNFGLKDSFTRQTVTSSTYSDAGVPIYTYAAAGSAIPCRAVSTGVTSQVSAGGRVYTGTVYQITAGASVVVNEHDQINLTTNGSTLVGCVTSYVKRNDRGAVRYVVIQAIVGEVQ